MDNNSILSTLSSNKEFIESLKEACISATEQTNDFSFSGVTKAIAHIVKSEIKPLLPAEKETTSKSRLPKDNTWKSIQKSNFSGRGRQWIYVDFSEIENILNSISRDGGDVKDYITAVERNNLKAWLRYSGPRINPTDNSQSAAFEIRYEGSKTPQTNSLYYFYMPHEKSLLLSESDRLQDGKTPHQLGLEESITSTSSIKKQPPKSKRTKTSSVKDTTLDNLAASLAHDAPEPEDAIEFPESLDPAEWEEFLLKEGLAVDLEDDLSDIE